MLRTDPVSEGAHIAAIAWIVTLDHEKALRHRDVEINPRDQMARIRRLFCKAPADDRAALSTAQKLQRDQRGIRLDPTRGTWAIKSALL